jgi:hypothetical protein
MTVKDKKDSELYKILADSLVETPPILVKKYYFISTWIAAKFTGWLLKKDSAPWSK